MERFEAPRADFAILAFLVFVTGIAGSIGALLYWLMLPIVVPNAVFAESMFAEPKRPAVLFLRQLAESATVPDMERAAVDSADEENAELGFKTPVVVAANPAPVEPVERKKDVKQTPKPPKKRVAQAPKRAPPHSWQAWGYAQNRPFGGGFWFQ